jgi:hypothetical protein
MSSPTSQSVTPTYVAANPTSLSGVSVTPSGFSPTVNWTVSNGVAPYKMRVNWGDGSTSLSTQASAGAGSLLHTYVTAKTYTVTVSATDSGVNGSNVTSASASTTVTITAPTVSGKVTQSNGTTPIAGVYMYLKLSGVTKKIAVTDASGNYTMTGVAAGTYTLTATKSGVTFPAPVAVDTNPGSQTVNISSTTP